MALATSTPQRSEDQQLIDFVDRIGAQRIVVVTGAGISAESGIPTYRGDDGYWTETSANYTPQEVGYLSFFRTDPREVWRWTLRHRGVCMQAKPNAAHRALARLEQRFGDGFLLVTQNVDGLHLRAGNSRARTVEAHGSLHEMRALDGATSLLPIPQSVACSLVGEPVGDASWALLTDPEGHPYRPHTMFFDEPYDEQLYRSDTAFAAARACDLLIVIGTSGATAMPWHLAVHALEADAAILVVDPNETPFGVHARNRERVGKGLWLRGSSATWTPRIVERLERARRSPKVQTVAGVRSTSAPKPAARAQVVLGPVAAPDASDYADSRALAELLTRRQPRRVVIMTGAGISAESGIPTFRGREGYWVVGPRPGRPTTCAEFEQRPREVWDFSLHRREVCNAAKPNPAHLALARLEAVLGDELRLITQNIDGLHLRAGNTPARTYELHGSCNLMRAIEGDPMPVEIPANWGASWDPSGEVLTMPDGSRARPHVLWWDESYNELQYRSESSLAAGGECDLLVVIGTSGAAAMPYAIAAQAVLEADATLIDINPEHNPYSEHACDRVAQGKGLWLRGSATRWVPELVEQLIALRS